MVSVRVPAGDSLGGPMGLHDSGDDSDGGQGHLLTAPRHAALHHQHQLLPPLHLFTSICSALFSTTSAHPDEHQHTLLQHQDMAPRTAAQVSPSRVHQHQHIIINLSEYCSHA